MSSPDRSCVLQQLEARQILSESQLVPAGWTAFGLLTVKESPRWLRSRDHINEVIARMAHIFCLGRDYYCIRPDIAEIADHLRSGTKETFVIAVVIFLLQQWTRQSSVGYYVMQIFAKVCLFHHIAAPYQLIILVEDWNHR